MRRERGGIGRGIAVAVVLIMLAFAACLAVADDDDENGMPLRHKSEQGDRSTGKDSDGKCQGADYCEDNDGINADKVIICLPESRCSFGGDEAAISPACLVPVPFHCDPRPTALFPPNPERLITAIQTGVEGIGKAAGILAGTIAAFVPSVLL